MQIPCSATLAVFCWKKARLPQQVSQSFEKLAIKMCEIVKEMCQQAPKRLMWFYILLSTDVAKSTYHFCITVQAVSFVPQTGMRHKVKFG
jgi:hypothetical protein